MIEPRYREFAQIVIDNAKRNGFPEKKVAFPIEKLSAAAEKRDIVLDRVLEILDEVQIAHIKTPEKIIFYAKDRDPISGVSPETEGNQPNPMNLFGDMDPSLLQGMDPTQLMAAAAQMVQNMSPEQLESARKMYESMSEEGRAALLEEAKKMGFF